MVQEFSPRIFRMAQGPGRVWWLSLLWHWSSW